MCDTLFNQTEKNIVYCIYIYWLFSSENVIDQICDNDVARKLNSKSFYYLVFYPEAELWKFTWNLVGHTIQYMTQQCDKYHLPSTKHRLCVGGRYKCYFKRFVFFSCHAISLLLPLSELFLKCLHAIHQSQGSRTPAISRTAGVLQWMIQVNGRFLKQQLHYVSEDHCRDWKWVELHISAWSYNVCNGFQRSPTLTSNKCL